jgi:DNA-binding Lrp family transcriptional regulator
MVPLGLASRCVFPKLNQKYFKKIARFARSLARTPIEMRGFRTILKISEENTHMLDSTDTQLLAALQKDAHLTAHQLGELLNLSPSQAGRRRQRLESDGYIQGYSARLDPDRLGLHVQGFVQVHLQSHGPDQAQSFARLVRTRPEIISAWTMTGEADYLLRVYCENLSSLNTLLHEVLLPHPVVARVQSQIVMDQMKRDAPLPT